MKVNFSTVWLKRLLEKISSFMLIVYLKVLLLKGFPTYKKKKLSHGEIPFHIFQSSEVYEVRYKVEDNTKSWDQLKREFSPNDSSFFKWLQLTQYQLLGKKILKGCSNTSNNPVHLNYHLAKGNHLFKCW